MKDFDRLINECLKEVEEAGITPGIISKWSVNHRAKKRWGSCKRKPGEGYEIEISSVLLFDDRVSEKACKETIIHEILHTVQGGNGHTGRWKMFAEQINAKYGYNIKRVTSGSEKGVEEYHSTYSLPYKYMFKCRYCGDTIFRKKSSKFTHYYRNYYCRSCGRLRAYEKYILKQ